MHTRLYHENESSSEMKQKGNERWKMEQFISYKIPYFLFNMIERSNQTNLPVSEVQS